MAKTELSAREARTQVTNLTKFLAQACYILEAHDDRMPKELAKWWKNHKKADTAKVKRLVTTTKKRKLCV